MPKVEDPTTFRLKTWTQSWRPSKRSMPKSRRKGRNLGSIRLQPAGTARTLRNVNGQRLVTDGPFADTKEHLGGLWLIEAMDLDEALTIARRLPDNAFATIEVRPVLGVDLRGALQAFAQE